MNDYLVVQFGRVAVIMLGDFFKTRIISKKLKLKIKKKLLNTLQLI